MSNQIKSALTKAQDVYMPQIVGTLENNDMQFTDYQKQCVIGAINQIHDALKDKGKTFNDVEQSSMTDALTLTASLQLNPAASPAEIYYILRNKNISGYGEADKWVTIIEPGIEGDGNDSLLSRFGRDVKTVHKFWEVREKDEFSYPKFNGLEMTPPQWSPTGKGKVVKVVYPITKENGETDFLISEREDVVINLKAHIRNNLMNETFGIAESRYKANQKQKNEIDEKKSALLSQLEGKGLEAILADDKFKKHISPAWKDNSESMIVRKMRNNVVKKYPKNFENAFVARTFSEVDEEVRSVRRTVSEEANQELIDFDEPEKTPEEPKNEPQEETKKEPEPTPKETPKQEPKQETDNEVIDGEFEEVTKEETDKNNQQGTMFENISDLEKATDLDNMSPGF